MRSVYFTAWVLARFVFAVCFRWRVLHPERVPLEGPVIVAANHASFLDPPLVGASLPREIHCLARESLFRFAIARWLLKACNGVPVDREGVSPAGMRAILERLLAGGAILLFPEGTRTYDGRLQPAHSGVGLAVIRSSAPVVPVRIFGSFEAHGRHLTFPRFRPLTIKYGRPLNFEALRLEARDCGRPRLKEIYREVAAEIMAAMATLTPHEDCDRFPPPPPGATRPR